jgi:hypothetical protein
MRFAPLFSLAALLAFAGCSASRSSTWGTVRASRLEYRAESSEAYADHLSATLKTSRVPHKVVTYEYRYRTPGGEEAIATRTAVLYRDGTDTRDRWWLMEDRLRTPAWVPGEDPEYQITFYLRRQATVVSVDGSGVGEGKREISAEPAAAVAFARLMPVRRTERSRKQIAIVRAEKPGSIPAKHLVAFRLRHGGKFDPSSVADRLKMERLLQGTRGTVASH